MIAVIIKAAFIIFMNLSPEFLTIYRDVLPLGAKFILNFPVIIPVLGVVIMGATYFITKDREEEEIRDFVS